MYLCEKAENEPMCQMSNICDDRACTTAQWEPARFIPCAICDLLNCLIDRFDWKCDTLKMRYS